MSLRPRRRTLVLWSSSAVAAGRAGPAGRRGPRPTRARRLCWWLRTGLLLTVIGARWLARSARTRWEPVFLLAGAALTAAGFALPAGGVFFAGMLVLVVTLLKGVASKGKDSRLAEWRS